MLLKPGLEYNRSIKQFYLKKYYGRIYCKRDVRVFKIVFGTRIGRGTV